MSCARLSLFTNVTLCPAVIVTLDGDTAPLAIVMVAPLGPGLPLGGVGDIGDPPSLHRRKQSRPPSTRQPRDKFLLDYAFFLLCSGTGSLCSRQTEGTEDTDRASTQRHGATEANGSGGLGTDAGHRGPPMPPLARRAIRSTPHGRKLHPHHPQLVSAGCRSDRSARPRPGRHRPPTGDTLSQSSAVSVAPFLCVEARSVPSVSSVPFLRPLRLPLPRPLPIPTRKTSSKY